MTTEATLTSTGGKPVLRFERFLPRPVEEVWRAVTDPAEMRAWFPTRIEIDRWEVCLERLVAGSVGEAWTSRFERYTAAYEPLLGAQDGPPTGNHG